MLRNVVGTVDLKTPLDLKIIALHARNAEYNPKRFSAVIMRLRDPKTTALIFGSGKVEESFRLAAHTFTRVIQVCIDNVHGLRMISIGLMLTQFSEFKVRNVMVTCDVRFPIRLEGLLNDHARFSSVRLHCFDPDMCDPLTYHNVQYKPELFPGLIYKLVEPKLTLLIFVSGKIVLCGSRDPSHLYQTIDKMYPVLLQYRKMTTAPSLVTGKPSYEGGEHRGRLEPRSNFKLRDDFCSSIR
ncbi:hypothetical protein PsorP6_005433 [Peronosclerospora sorghi]|uniref:Uncharacterized protein n=1 Tax=Peronosclerospora sorghi TaxID=230839 RepID=A0ACC0W7M3_9STRA|nr:hypothetical protein PsorP6_005433 [Peronosclerospora sorghi]